MKILFLTNFFPPASLGGYDQLCQEVGDKLKCRGHDVVVLTSNYRSIGLSEPDPDWVHRDLYLEMELAAFRNAFQFFTQRKTREAKNLESLRHIVSRFSSDVVIVWGMWNLQPSLPALAEELMPGRILYYICDHWPTLPNQFQNYWNAPAQGVFFMPIKLILRPLALKILSCENRPDLKLENALCCSEYLRNTLVEAGALPPNASVVYNGIDPDPFLKYSKSSRNLLNEKNNLMRLLYFGRLDQSKGVHTAIQALGLLKEQSIANNVDLTILGSGNPDYEATLQRMVIELGISERVTFIPHVHRDAIPSLLSHFDIYLFTSIWPEAMARTVMEAMAAGLLVIGTEVGGQAEMLIPGKNALTFEPGDVNGLSDQIMRAYRNPELRDQLVQVGQTMVSEQFTLDRMVNEIENILQNIVNSPAPK